MSFTYITPTGVQHYMVQENYLYNIDQAYSHFRVAQPDEPVYQHATLTSMINSAGSSDLQCHMQSIHISKRYATTTAHLRTYMRSQVSSNFDNTENLEPLAVRYVSRSGIRYVERYPFQATVDFSDGNRKKYIKASDNIRIWVPWTLTRLRPNSTEMAIYYAGHSLMSAEDRYFAGALPNSYQGAGFLCWGSAMNNYPEFHVGMNTGTMSASDKTLFTTLFNEYFSGGWNTDLGSNIYWYLRNTHNHYYNKKDEFPMIHRFCNPGHERITQNFRHISAARRRMLSDGLMNLNSNRLKQCAYVLYMLSDFTLSETLEFYEEMAQLSTLLNEHSIQLSNYATFGELAANTKSVGSSAFNDGGFNWVETQYAPTPSHSVLRNQVESNLNNSFTTFNIYYYNFRLPPNSSVYRSYVTGLMGGTFAEILADFVSTHFEDQSGQWIYMVDVENKSFTKTLALNDDSINLPMTMIPASERRAMHHAFVAHYNMLTSGASYVG